MYGWMGKILRVDLTKGKIYKESTMNYASKFIGGTGIASAILYNEVPPEVRPFDPENRIIFNTGPLTGTLAPSCGRWSVTMKSPVTEAYSDSNGGGFWAPELKWAGYDHIVVHGRAEKPVYLWINDDVVEIRSASHLWGKDTWKTQEMIREELGDPEVKTVKIGPAGENMCFAGCTLGDISNAAGRGGSGAVMGSKNLKAIAVRGTGGVKIANLDKFEEVCEEMHEKIRNVSIYDKFSTGGTPWLVHDGMIKASGRENVEDEKKVLIDKFMPYFVKSKGCYNCPMHCGHVYRVQEGPYAGIEGEGCEANAINDFTTTVGCFDVPFVLKCNEVCDRLGVGVDEAGHMYAFGAELYKKGIITSKDTDGMEFRLGDQEAILEHIRKMAYREGFGDVMADLVVKGGKRIGKGAEEVARDRNLKKQLSYPLRSSYTQALSYSTSTRGSCHLKSTPFVYEMWLPAWYPMEYVREVGLEKFGDPEACITPGNPNGKALMTTEGEYMCYVCDFTIICKFVTRKTIYDALNIADIAKMLTPLTGIEYKREDLVKTAQRINAVQRAFNCREGYRREDDYPPPATFKEYKMIFGKKVVIEQNKYDKLLDEYYTMHGVNLKTGIPTRQRLEELDLKDVADDLTKRGILKEFEKKAKNARANQASA